MTASALVQPSSKDLAEPPFNLVIPFPPQLGRIGFLCQQLREWGMGGMAAGKLIQRQRDNRKPFLAIALPSLHRLPRELLRLHLTRCIRPNHAPHHRPNRPQMNTAHNRRDQGGDLKNAQRHHDDDPHPTLDPKKLVHSRDYRAAQLWMKAACATAALTHTLAAMATGAMTHSPAPSRSPTTPPTSTRCRPRR